MYMWLKTTNNDEAQEVSLALNINNNITQHSTKKKKKKKSSGLSFKNNFTIL